MKLAQLSSSIVLLWGAKRYALAALAGVLSAFAMPPYGAFPVLFLTLPVVVWLLDGVGAAGGRLAVAKASLVLGWWFGFGYFLSGLWWIGAAFLVDAAAHAWLMPVAVVALPMALACFYAVGFWVARLLWSSGMGRIFALAFGLGGADLVRGHVFTGFPWNSFGYALADTGLIGQWAAFIGVEGLTYCVLVIFALPALMTDRVGKTAWRPLMSAFAVLLVMAGAGAIRLFGTETTYTDMAVRVMQPNVPQDEKFRPERKSEIMEHYLALSDEATSPERQGIADIDLLIWPESAFPFFLNRTPDALAAIAAALPERTTLLTGAARADRLEAESEQPRFTNSVHMINGQGVIQESYDKVRLVPFGEFVPFENILEKIGISHLVEMPGGFSPGDRPRTIKLPNGLGVGALICYEAIFPWGNIDSAEKPDLLVNVTNDAWFGLTPGPYQHLAQARVRAIELGLPLIRAANTGISAVIDPYGRIVSRLDLGITGVLDTWVPQSLDSTFYLVYRWLPAFLFPCFTGLMAFWMRKRI